MHDKVAEHLKELKQIIIKYYPTRTSDELNDTLFDIFTCEEELSAHNRVEDLLFVPAVEALAARVESEPQRTTEPEALSAREKEIIVCVVKGMTNKEIADELCISAHTVITHRRNIASKLQIHSAAGLTIYAIVNKLVDLSEIKETIERE
jgi:regulator of cell morphogenesis and NO signaling